MSPHHDAAFPSLRVRHSFAALLRPVGLSAATAIAASSAYLGVLTVAGLQGERVGRRRTNGAADASGSPTTFAVLIPAHDEQLVVAATVRALVDQRYPEECFSVHVVADNCTDATADVARGAGARVHERNDPDDPGKGAALNWLCGQVTIEDVDAVVVVDADTVADPHFLSALDRAFADGGDVLQGDYGVLDPERSSVVGLRYAALACRHRLRPLGRRALGCSCGLYGNGMAFRTGLIADRPWSGHLVEDAQFQLDLLLDGIIVSYVPDARISAEMPATMHAALTQHQRWELGRTQLIRRYLPSLVRQAVRPASGLKRRVYLDAIADLLMPPLSIVAAVTLLGVATNAVAHTLAPRSRTARSTFVSGAGAVTLAAHVVAGLKSAHAPRSVWLSLASAPRLVVWKLLLLARIARRPDDVVWTRTQRNEDTIGHDSIVGAAS